MTQDEIIEMARQAGVRDDERIFEFSQYKYLERFANLVAAKAFQSGYEKGIAGFNEAVSLEREACAKVCDARLEKWVSLFGKDKMYKWIIHLPKAIRARGEQA